MSEILTMNLKTLNERLEAASLAGGVASDLEKEINKIENDGITTASIGFLIRKVGNETVEAIEKMILEDLQIQLEVATEEFHKTLIGGQK